MRVHKRQLPCSAVFKHARKVQAASHRLKMARRIASVPHALDDSSAQEPQDAANEKLPETQRPYALGAQEPRLLRLSFSSVLLQVNSPLKHSTDIEL